MDGFWLGLVTVGALLGSVVGVAALLNARDRRADRLLGLVAAQFSPRALRNDVALRVKTGLLSRTGRVEVAVGDWVAEPTWLVIDRLARTLPPWTTLRVDGALAAPRGTRIRVDSRPALRRGEALPAQSLERHAA